MARIRRILHATDFSRASRPAFAAAVDMARANRAELVLLHALSPPIVPTAGEGYVSPELFERLQTSARAGAQKQMDGLLRAARKAGARAAAVIVDGGTPHEQILRAAKAKRVDTIVLGTHGRTGLARFFLGSVASRVVSTSPVPVLTVRGSAR